MTSPVMADWFAPDDVHRLSDDLMRRHWAGDANALKEMKRHCAAGRSFSEYLCLLAARQDRDSRERKELLQAALRKNPRLAEALNQYKIWFPGEIPPGLPETLLQHERGKKTAAQPVAGISWVSPSASISDREALSTRLDIFYDIRSFREGAKRSSDRRALADYFAVAEGRRGTRESLADLGGFLQALEKQSGNGSRLPTYAFLFLGQDAALKKIRKTPEFSDWARAKASDYKVDWSWYSAQ